MSARFAIADGAGQREPVPTRHVKVGEENLEAVLLPKLLECFFPIARGDDGVSLFGEKELNELGIHRVVLCY